MKKILFSLLLACTALLMPSCEKEKPYCEQYNVATLKVFNSNSVITEIFINGVSRGYAYSGGTLEREVPKGTVVVRSVTAAGEVQQEVLNARCNPYPQGPAS